MRGQGDSLFKRYRAWVAGLGRGARLRWRLLQITAVLFLVSGGMYLGLRAWVRVPEVPDYSVQPPQPSTGSSSASEEGVSFAGAQIPNILFSGRREGIYTFLLAGKDVISGATDTILLLTYDTNERTIHGLNLPRDTIINTSASSKRLNAVFARSRGSRDLSDQERTARGMTALKWEVAKLTGITPDFYVLVEWEAIGRLVDALEGVEFEVPFDMDYDDIYQDLHIHQKAGLRVLSGEDAMEVVRWRKNNSGYAGSDVARLAIQQDFLKAVAKKCLQPATLLKAPALADIFLDNVETDLTLGNILAFAELAYGMDPERGVRFDTAPAALSFQYRGASVLALDGEGILEIVNDGMNPYLRDIRMDDLELLYRKSDGSLGVTRGELADPAMGRAPEPKPEPEPPDGSQGGAHTGPGEPSGEEPSGEAPLEEEPLGEDPLEEPQEGGLPGEIDPEDVLPDPDGQPDQEAQIDGTVAVLPSRPLPVEEGAA